MTKQDCIDAVAERTGLSKREAADAVDATLGAITDALRGGDKVALVGFGTFEVKHRKARQGRNPRDGSVIQIPAHNVPAFKAGKALKDAVA